MLYPLSYGGLLEARVTNLAATRRTPPPDGSSKNAVFCGFCAAVETMLMNELLFAAHHRYSQARVY